MARERRRPGPQPKPAELRKRANLTFRVTDRMRDQLAQAAAAEGRSISEEIEHRLARSFYQRELIGNALPLLQFAEDMVDVLRLVERYGARPAFGAEADAAAYVSVWSAFDAWFAANRPAGAPALQDAPPDQRHRERALALLMAREAIAAITRIDLTGPLSEAELAPVKERIREHAELLLALLSGSPEDG
jgi:Arc-like DNA binding dprotein